MYVIWFVQIESVITVQRNFRCQHGDEPTTAKTIRNWLKSFKNTGSVLKVKFASRPRTSEATVKQIHVSCVPDQRSYWPDLAYS